jgi:hypothetical protein
MKLISIKKSTNPKKKYEAIFKIDDKNKKVSFGASGYDDYTITKNKKQKELYINRHKKNENWENPTSAGALSRFILWNKPTLNGSIKDFKQKFNI